MALLSGLRVASISNSMTKLTVTYKQMMNKNLEETKILLWRNLRIILYNDFGLRMNRKRVDSDDNT